MESKDKYLIASGTPSIIGDDQLVNIKAFEANYVILDGALLGEDLKYIQSKYPINASLFATKGADYGLDSVAPYIFLNSTEFYYFVRYKKDEKYRGVYLFSGMPLEKMRRHLRHFLRVKTDDKKWLFFRLYDPYVMNCVLPNLTTAQLFDFFREIDYIVTEDFRIMERRIFYLSSQGRILIKKEIIN